ncbi:hypothetical protein FLGE108171_13495 [Flavobacterium gelidilacus]|uniref:hypothetical protein n=1 Tax=Flavobacterium gelidilacus TaxID=206041 RepID=UPI00041B948C|nr:hypothetical protein [Flavobacterium gelidilacus]
MKTKYTEKIIYYLEADVADEAFMQWVEQQPLLDQPDIMREFKQIVTKRLNERGIFDYDFEEMDEDIANYEDKILDEKLAEANLVMAMQDQEKHMKIIDETVAQVREYIINCIINKEENAEAMKELAAKVIASEKETGVYEEKNWLAIL